MPRIASLADSRKAAGPGSDSEDDSPPSGAGGGGGRGNTYYAGAGQAVKEPKKGKDAVDELMQQKGVEGKARGERVIRFWKQVRGAALG